MQQPIRHVKDPIHATITLPGSKGITQRALLLAALADGVSEISGLQLSDDTHLYINALHQLGIAVQLDENTKSCIIAGCNGKFPKKQASVWCDHSLAIARYLIAACSGTAGVYYFDGSMSLRKKSMTHLLQLLNSHGVQLTPNDANGMPFTLIGADSLEGGEILLSSPTNNKLVSPLLMIAPYARSPFTFTLLHTINHPHIMMTCAMMAEFGVLVHHIHHGQMTVPTPQRYQARDYTVEPDLSMAVYFFAAAAITHGELTIQPIKRLTSKQPGIKFLSILEKMGCTIQEKHSGLTVKGPLELQGIDISLQDSPDAILALIAMAPFAKTPTKITYAGIQNQKESQRIHLIKEQLSAMGVKIESGENWVHIFPSEPYGSTVNTQHDKHIAMVFSLIGLKVPNVVIDNIEHVIKMHPEFFALWNKLTEQINVNAQLY